MAPPRRSQGSALTGKRRRFRDLGARRGVAVGSAAPRRAGLPAVRHKDGWTWGLE